MKVICSWRLRKKKRPDMKQLKVLVAEIAESAKLKLAPHEIISVNFIGTQTMRRINREFLAHDRLTDVICFDYRDDDTPQNELAIEIFISPDIAMERSREIPGTTYPQEMLLYLVHAILHASGMRDSTAKEKKEMRKAEEKILTGLAIRNTEFPI